MQKSFLLILLLSRAWVALAQQPALAPYRATSRQVNDLVNTKLDVRFDYARRYLYGQEWLTLRPHGVAKLKISEMGSRYFFICAYLWLEKYFSRGDYRRK